MYARLAPSPTGALHVGNARTFLIAWLDARSRGQRLLLRIEDIDSPRVKPGTTAALVADLRTLGLDWDGEPVVQTQRLPHYAAALQQLQERELVYPCTCTRSDIEQAASAPHASTEPTYPGTCAGRSATDAAALAVAGRPYAWRFRVTHTPAFIDRFAGPVELDLRQHGGDFVVWKSADTPAYQLAVVVDDAAQQICDVVRGDDLIPSTPRQLLLYAALGLPAPRFAHVPLVVGPDGRRLAKRHGDTRLSSLWAAGVTPEALVGLLAWSCGWRDRIAPVSPHELLADYRLDAIPPRPFVLTSELLQQIGYTTPREPPRNDPPRNDPPRDDVHRV